MPTNRSQDDLRPRGQTEPPSRSTPRDPSADRASLGAHSSAAKPRVWVIMGYRAGERTQVAALAEALGWPFEIKELRHQTFDFVPGLLRLKSLAGIARRDRGSVAPPWPDIVISAGMRNEPICRWIQQQSKGVTKLVHIGRPWARLEHFDLVITTPQYRLPNRPNVLQNVGTLHQVTPETLKGAASEWFPRFANLPKPHIGVIVGGNSGPYTFGPRAAERLARDVSKLLQDSGGSAIVTTSARTNPRAADILERELTCPKYFFRWSPGAAENPYLGLLAAADQIVVTSDSVSMLSEAAATGKPVYIFDLGADRKQHESRLEGATGDSILSGRGKDFRFTAYLYALLMKSAHPRLTRDLSLFHQALIASGRAGWIGSELGEAPEQSSTDIDRAVDAVHRLIRT